ncbi:non-ribosomal peptide synthetase [Microbulbifer sp.]|uniref:non-ribosomal peptide synthetase n=1 Tax=Microbulbifer sp. TaxID=1908541 RepID=UPI003F308A40
MNLDTGGEPLSPQQKALADSAPALRWAWLDLGQGIDAVSVKLALCQLVARHETLRTRYRQPEGWSGLRQLVLEPGELRLDWRAGGAEEGVEPQVWRCRAEAAAADNRPDLVAWLYRDHRGGSRLLLGLPGLSLDDASLLRLRDELLDACARGAADTGEAPMQYREYVSWIRELQREDSETGEGAQFWRNQGLDRLPGGRLPEVYGSPGGEPGLVQCPFPAELQRRLADLSGEWDCAGSVPLLAVWTALLGRLTGRDGLQLGHCHDCREDYDELAGSLGLFEQLLPLACQLPERVALRGLARELSAQLAELADWQEYATLPDLLPLWQPSRQAGFRWRRQAHWGALQADIVDSGCELLLQAVRTDSGDGQLSLWFDSGLYREGQMRRLLARLLRLLELALERPDAPLMELDILLDDEGSAALEPREPMGRAADIVDCFRASAAGHPRRAALRCGSREYTYRELDGTSDRVAAALQAAGAGPERIVALCLPRGPEAVIAMLAALKAGAAYLPLDPQQPVARLQKILEDAQPAVLLAEDKDDCPAGPWKILDWPTAEGESAMLRPASRLPEHLAYVLYTSGSSGRPKGVQVENAQLNHYCEAAIQALALPAGGHYGLVSSLVADLGNTVLFPAWVRGGCLHLLDRAAATDGRTFAAYQAEWPLDVLKIVPSHLEALLEGQDAAALLPRQRLVLGGEPVGAALLRRLADAAPACRIFNHYGPTETTVGVLWSEVDPVGGDTALTSAIGGNRIHLLDGAGRPVPRGQAGELCVGGPGVTRGYLGNPEATAAAYTGNPFGAGRLYRTGDLALQESDGAIRILGRRDNQVKLRGFRFELEEVERALRAAAGTDRAAALVDGEGDRAQLVALLAAPPDDGFAERLRSALARQLPDYMIPARILPVDTLPLGDNGKIDRGALAGLVRRAGSRTPVPPEGELERTILAVWRELLGREDIGVTDNFFDIGGHSLAAIKVVARLRERLQRALPTTLLFDAQTVRALAATIVGDPEPRRWQCYGEVPESPAVVVLHAVSGHLLPLRPLIDALRGRVSLYGLAADSAVPDESDPDCLERLLEGYMAAVPESLRDTPLVLVGWSLAARLALLLSGKLQARGFRVQGLALLDYDPGNTLQGAGDEAGQLLADLDHYCETRGIALPDGCRRSLAGQIAGCDYAVGAELALSRPDLLEALGGGVPADWIRERVAARWAFKKLMYAAPLPRVDVPLWVWACRGGPCNPEAWQPYSRRPVWGGVLESDHFSIPASVELHRQLLERLAESRSTVS